MKNISIPKLIVSGLLIILSIACCMLPKSYKGSIEQTNQEAIIFFNDGKEDLILKVDPKITGEGKLSHFTWIITVPNEPEKYDVKNEDVFETFFKLKNKYLIKPVRERGIGCSEKSAGEKFEDAKYAGVELGKYVEVGDYAIQPVRGVGKNAFDSLNAWLADNDFPTETQEHMQYFIDSNFTFLCIKIKPNSDTPNFSPQLKPLQLTFKSEKPYYPMKFSSQQGNFSVNIYTVTSMPVDYKKSDQVLKKIDWMNDKNYKNVNLAGKDLPKEIADSTNTNPEYLYFNNFYCMSPNFKKSISKWTEDVFFSLDKSHSPNSSNLITRTGISWTSTLLLAAGILILLFLAKKKWKRLSSTAK